MVDVKDLVVRFGRVRAVDGVSFQVPPGSAMALWGANGAGKTTVIRALLGLVPFVGHISIGGRDPDREPREARAQIGYVPQQLGLYDDMTALGYLRFIAGLRGPARHVETTSQRRADASPGALLERVGLSEHAGKAVGHLSGGMRQRLGLAAALIGDPPVLVLDEPTANLDAAAQVAFLKMLADLRGGGKTLLVTSHRRGEVAALADRVVVLEKGHPAGNYAARDWVRGAAETGLLHVGMSPEAIPSALEALAEYGYAARRNGSGILVEVRADEQVAPLGIVMRRGIEVREVALRQDPVPKAGPASTVEVPGDAS